jgi:hypothetical protein
MEVTALKKVFATVCLLVVLTMAVAMMASAAPATTQGGWRLNIKAADLTGVNSNGDLQVGVYSSSTDGYGVDGVASDSTDTRAVLAQATSRAAVAVFDNKAWTKDIKSPRLPQDPAYNAGQAVGAGNGDAVFGTSPWEANRRIWDLRVAGLGSANSTDTLLTIKFVSTAVGLAPLTIPEYGTDPAVLSPASYALRMVDNRGIAGAPANGTVWSIPVPAAWQTASFFNLTLPTFNITVAKDEQALLAQGYKMEFYQTPEPSSLMALGAGLMGLGGFFSRRRRS